MRVLVASSSSEHSDQIIEDLRLAGLGAHTHTRLFTRADVEKPAVKHATINTRFESEWSYELSRAPLDFTNRNAERMHRLIATHFPQWFVEQEATPEFTARAVVDVARAWRADLILLDVVTADALHDELSLEDALSIARDAQCSVRVVQKHHKHEDRALRLLIALDGSEECGQAVDVALRREFSHNTKIYLLHVAEMPNALPSQTLSMERSMVFHESGRADWVRHMLSYFESHLDPHFRHIETHIRLGSPAQEILEFSKEYEIDAILVGAHGLERTGGTAGDRSSGGADRSSATSSHPLGRTATALIMHPQRAAVEIVRRPSHW